MLLSTCATCSSVYNLFYCNPCSSDFNIFETSSNDFLVKWVGKKLVFDQRSTTSLRSTVQEKKKFAEKKNQHFGAGVDCDDYYDDDDDPAGNGNVDDVDDDDGDDGTEAQKYSRARILRNFC